MSASNFSKTKVPVHANFPKSRKDSICDPTSGWDPFSLDANELLESLNCMAGEFSIAEKLNISGDKLNNFFLEVEKNMPNNPYHNFTHICDVTQFVMMLVKSTRAEGVLTPLEIAALFLGAVSHDLKHPGYSNKYINNEKWELVSRFSETSTLEKYHFATFLELAALCGILSGISAQEKNGLERIVENVILSTDMATHKNILERFQRSQSLASSSDREFFMSVLLKCADISNQSRSWTIANRWNDAVYLEFYREGDADAKVNRPVDALLNRHTNQVSKSSVGFIGFVVLPLFQHLKTMLESTNRDGVLAQGVEVFICNLEENKQRYQKQQQEIDEHKRKCEVEDLLLAPISPASVL